MLLTWIIDYFLPFILILTVLVFVHELGHFLAARRSGVKVTVFSIGFGPKLFGWMDKYGTSWQFSLIPLGGYVKMLGDADPSSSMPDAAVNKLSEEEYHSTLHSKTPWQRIGVAFAGPAANFLFAIVILVFLISMKGLPVLSTTIGKVEPGLLAHQSGLMAGDKILKINGENVQTFDQLRAFIRHNSGGNMTVEIKREGAIVEKVLHLYEMDPETGEKKPVQKLGIAPGYPEYIQYPPIQAVGEAIKMSWSLCADTFKGLVDMIAGQKGSGDLGGILSIGDAAAQSTRNGAATLFWFMAILSINLGFINLLPVPVLDGGHILLCAIEGIRGKPLSQKLQEYIFLAGFLVVIGTMVFATWKDLTRYKVFQTIASWF